MPLRTLVQPLLPLLPLQRSVHESSLNPKSYTLNPKATATLCLGEQRAPTSLRARAHVDRAACKSTKRTYAMCRTCRFSFLQEYQTHRTSCVYARCHQRRPHSSDRACRFVLLQEYQTHRWHVYIRGANNEDLTPLIERVIFQLHPGESKL